jgi:hypothetical protein
VVHKPLSSSAEAFKISLDRVSIEHYAVDV